MENTNISNNKTKKNIILSIVLVISLVLLTFSVSYAFFAKKTVKNGSETKVDVTSGKLNVDFITSEYITNDNAKLVNDNEVYINADKCVFDIERASDNTTEDVYYVIDLVDINISDNLKQSTYFKWALYDSNTLDSSSVPIVKGNFTNLTDNKLSIINTPVSLPKDITHAYSLLIWTSNDESTLQNELLEGTFNAKVMVTAVNSN